MRAGMDAGQAADTLVVYVYSNSDSEYERNLHFFVERGMADGDGCHYIIVVQEVGALQKAALGQVALQIVVQVMGFADTRAGQAFGREVYETVICRRAAMATT